MFHRREALTELAATRSWIKYSDDDFVTIFEPLCRILLETLPVDLQIVEVEACCSRQDVTACTYIYSLPTQILDSHIVFPVLTDPEAYLVLTSACLR